MWSDGMGGSSGFVHKGGEHALRTLRQAYGLDTPEPAVIDRLVEDEPDAEDVAFNDVEHDERCCITGQDITPSWRCPGVEELYRLDTSDYSGDVR